METDKCKAVSDTGGVRGEIAEFFKGLCRHVFGVVGKNAGDKITSGTWIHGFQRFWGGEVGQDAVGVFDWPKRSRRELISFLLFG
jgi:hypothetical protein